MPSHREDVRRHDGGDDRPEAVDALRDALALLMGADRRGRQRTAAPDALSHTHLRALFLLLRQGQATAGDLARTAHLNPASVTAMVDQLQRRGLVERRRHAVDRRICLVALTAPGVDLVSAQERRTAARLEGLLDGITDEELRATTRVLDRLAALLDDADDATDANGPGSTPCGPTSRRPTPHAPTPRRPEEAAVPEAGFEADPQSRPGGCW